MIGVAVACAALSGYAGLLVSYHAGLPSGPAIILVAGVLYALSVAAGPVGGLIWLSLTAPPSGGMTMYRQLRLVALVALAAAYVAVFLAAPAQAQDKLKVVASLSIIGDLVQKRRRRPGRGRDAGRPEQRLPTCSRRRRPTPRRSPRPRSCSSTGSASKAG